MGRKSKFLGCSENRILGVRSKIEFGGHKLIYCRAENLIFDRNRIFWTRSKFEISESSLVGKCNVLTRAKKMFGRHPKIADFPESKKCLVAIPKMLIFSLGGRNWGAACGPCDSTPDFAAEHRVH